MRAAFSVFLVLALGCGGEPTEARDTARQADDADGDGDGAEADSDVGSDVDTVGLDASAPDVDQDDAATPEVGDSAAPDSHDPDVASDVSEVSEIAADSLSDAEFPTDRPRGQCAASDDCPGTLFCAETAPGGICNGCGAEPCPDGTSCNEFGACARDCGGDDDCPVGLRCHPTQDICALKSCSSGADCEAPYVCESGFCRRPSCEVGSACPAPLACEGGVCVEPYWAE